MYQIEYPCCPDMSELLVVSRYNITKLKSAGGACLPISCLKVKTAQAPCGWQFAGLWGTWTQYVDTMGKAPGKGVDQGSFFLYAGLAGKSATKSCSARPLSRGLR